ncbi:MAG: GNAT family N-acetyltransferase [Halobacteriaceae archaeon]
MGWGPPLGQVTGIEVTVHRTLDGVTPTEWNAVVAEQSSTGSVFERYGWLRAHEAATGTGGRYVEVREDGTLVGVLAAVRRPVPGTGLRFLGPPRPGYAGPSIATDERAVLDALLDAVLVDRSWRTIGHLVKPSRSAALRYARNLRSRGYVPTVRSVEFLVDVDRPWDAVEGDFRRDTRRNLQTADERDVTTRRVEPTPADVDRFFERHREAMDRLDGEGASRALLQALRRHVPERILLFRASVDGEDVGQQFAVCDRERGQVHLLFPGWSEEGFAYESPTALYRAALRWAVDAEWATACNLGETDPDHESGNFRYKEGFGGDLVPTVRWERVHSRPLRVAYLLSADSVPGAVIGAARRFLSEIR